VCEVPNPPFLSPAQTRRPNAFTYSTKLDDTSLSAEPGVDLSASDCGSTLLIQKSTITPFSLSDSP
jgi:hypothetical protein